MSSVANPALAQASGRTARSGPSWWMRLLITAAALAVWFGAQALIGSRGMRSSGIGDGLLEWTAPANHYLFSHPRAANALLIGSSAVIDALGLLLLGKWIFGRKPRPFVAL